MPNVKKVIHDWNETGEILYAMLVRDVDGFFLASDRSGFAVGVGYPALVEDAVIKGRYVLTTADAVWNDGLYTFAIYKQAGGVPSPSDDVIVGTGLMYIAADSEVGESVRSVVAPVTVSTNNDKTGYSGVATNMVAEPDNAGIALVKAKTNLIPAEPASVSDIPTAAAIATAVWDSGVRTLTSFGSLVADMWAYVSRTLTSSAPPTPEQIATAVWGTDIGSGDAGTVLNGVGAVANPFDTIVEGSDPPATRGEVIDHLYIPDYEGPIAVIPAPPTPNQQTLYGHVKEFGAAVWSAGDTVEMTLHTGSQMPISVLEPVKRTVTIAADGLFILTPDKGATVEIKFKSSTNKVYGSKIFTVSQDDTRDIVTY